MAKQTDDQVPCPRCGHQAELPSAWRRDANLIMTCASCGEVHLALNAVRLQMHKFLAARGLSENRAPPDPLPLEAVKITPLADGKTELVYRRSKRGGETVFIRKTKPEPGDI